MAFAVRGAEYGLEGSIFHKQLKKVSSFLLLCVRGRNIAMNISTNFHVGSNYGPLPNLDNTAKYTYLRGHLHFDTNDTEAECIRVAESFYSGLQYKIMEIFKNKALYAGRAKFEAAERNKPRYTPELYQRVPYTEAARAVSESKKPTNTKRYTPATNAPNGNPCQLFVCFKPDEYQNLVGQGQTQLSQFRAHNGIARIVNDHLNPPHHLGRFLISGKPKAVDEVKIKMAEWLAQSTGSGSIK